MDHEALTSVRRTKTLPPTYLLLAIFVMATVDVLFPGHRVVPLPWSLVGIVPLMAGVALNLVADSDLKKHGTTVKPFQESSSLVTTGAYRLCRHPMYLGFVLILCGLGVVMGTVMPFVVVPLFIAVIETTFIRAEEQMMGARFGDAWRAYKSKVRRWI